MKFVGSVAMLVVMSITGLVGMLGPTDARAQSSSSNLVGPMLTSSRLRLSAHASIALDKLVGWGIFLGVAYYILDPLAPNWEIEETPLGDQHVHYLLTMRRLHNGGDGEARVIFHRRAKEIMRLNEFDAYEVVEYSERLDSSMVGSQRVAEGVVKLTRKSG